MSASGQVERLSIRLLGRHRTHVRVLTDTDRGALIRLCRRDPVSNVFVHDRALTDTPLSQGGQLWGWFEGGRMRSACWSGANFVLVEPNAAALEGFAARARHAGNRCMSICGPAGYAMQFWHLVQPTWQTPREVRANQPLMQIDRPSSIPPDPQVRLATMADLDVLLPACVAMFTEEVGYSPVAAGGGWSYRARVEHLIRSGRSFVRLDDHGRVMFKAELGAVSDTVAQVQGVYVDPAYRGRGLAAPGMAAVVELTRRQVAPVVSLYVNDFNQRAIAAYRRAGFRQVGAFATILF